MGQNRIFYSCLGVALAAPNLLLPRIQSASISASQDLNSVISSNGVNFYSNIPDINCSYTQIIHSFDDLYQNINDYLDLYMLIGPENSSELVRPTKYILCKYLLLESIEYNLSVDSFFTVTKTFTGFSRYTCDYDLEEDAMIIDNDNIFVPYRQHITITSDDLPEQLLNSPIQNITIKRTLNRQPINEAGTQTPYAFRSQIPTETTANIEFISQTLDDYQYELPNVSCIGVSTTPASITINMCVPSSTGINNISTGITGFISNINYTGGGTDGSNQNISIEIKNYGSDTNFIEFPNGASTGCFEG